MKYITQKPKILFMATFPPTECGIATYTTDLMNAISSKFSNTFTCVKCELTEKTDTLAEFILNPKQKEDYSHVAGQINMDESISLIHIQHEFGLFDGTYGDYLFDFLEVINKPIIFTFHTIIPEPNDKLKSVVKRLTSYATCIFVMTKQSIKLLETVYQINPKVIEYVPHGTHLIKWCNQEELKEKFDFKNRPIISTFGLIGPGKSIETALKALPKIIEYMPNVLYLIIGKTHPNEIKNNTDGYRNYLEWLVEDLKIHKNVLFINRYLTLNELLEILQATDIYLFTSKDPNQAVSGTFSYAMSCACPIIATSIPHTKEILTKDLGFLIDNGDTQVLANTTIELLSDKKMRDRLSVNAFQKTRESAWENIAIKQAKVCNKIINEPHRLKYDYPLVKLDHIKKMTTARGIIQFSKICIPDIASGYTLDDNARALIVMCMHYDQFRDTEDLKYINIYLDFIIRCQKNQGTFINYIDGNNQVHIKNDYVNLEDSNARAVWALGTVISFQDILPEQIVEKAIQCILKCSQWIKGVLSPRAIGFTIKGLYNYNTVKQENYIMNSIEILAENLMTKYDINKVKDWKWFESYMTYANSILPEAMLYAYLSTGKEAYKQTALESFDFLLSKTFQNGQFKVISNKGWHHKGKESYSYGEQPIDVAYTIQALEVFYKTFKAPKYKNMMEKAFSWFLGNNHLNQIIYNPLTGGCNDGLEKENVNLNQGAESTVCYLIARLIMKRNLTSGYIEKVTRYTTKKLPRELRISKTKKISVQ